MSRFPYTLNDTEQKLAINLLIPRRILRLEKLLVAQLNKIFLPCMRTEDLV
jgi:hypothetical protein